VIAMLLANVLRPRADAWNPMDDRWYVSHPDLAAGGGVSVTAESMFRCTTVLAAVRFLCNSFGMCPPQVFRKTADGRKDDPEHYLQRLLRDPGPSWTAIRWQQVNILRAATWGNSYNLILPSADRWAGRLKPLDPACVRVLPESSSGEMLYEYTGTDGRKEGIEQGRMLHFRGLSLDGLTGAPIYQLVREAVRIALFAEAHLGAFLRKGARLAGLIVPEAPLDKPQRDELRASLNESLTGPTATGGFGVMPYGLKVQNIGSSNRDSQLFELSDAQVGAILRALGVPGVVVGYMGDKTATYASADAFFEKGGIRNTLQPWLTTFEQEISKALLVGDDPHYLKFNMDVLMRANTKDRYEALYRACGRPWLSGNEVREIENWNADADPSMDKVLMPVNMATGEPEPEPEPPPPAPPPPTEPALGQDDEQAAAPAPPPAPAQESTAERFVLDAASRVVRREIADLGRGRNGGGGSAVQFSSNPERWHAAVDAFYARHAGHVAEIMRISDEQARGYCQAQAEALKAGGMRVVETWPDQIPPRLAALALNGGASCSS
jgi:HK97 family phage portal protein